jgi:hypothetical protein
LDGVTKIKFPVWIYQLSYPTSLFYFKKKIITAKECRSLVHFSIYLLPLSIHICHPHTQLWKYFWYSCLGYAFLTGKLLSLSTISGWSVLDHFKWLSWNRQKSDRAKLDDSGSSISATFSIKKSLKGKIYSKKVASKRQTFYMTFTLLLYSLGELSLALELVKVKRQSETKVLLCVGKSWRRTYFQNAL